MDAKRFHRTGYDRNFITVTRLYRTGKSDGIEFKIQTGKLYGTEDGFTRAEMHDFHAALGEMLGLGVPTAKAPMTASKPAKNPRRVNGGV